jgi:hypothetical protein
MLQQEEEVKSLTVSKRQYQQQQQQPLVHNADPGPTCSRITKLTARRK